MSNDENLQERIRELEQKLSEKEVELTKIPRITKTVTVPPADYLILKKNYAELVERYSQISAFLSYSEAPTISKLVMDFEKNTRISLERIVREYAVVGCGKPERRFMLSMVTFLREAIEQIEMIVDYQHINE